MRLLTHASVKVQRGECAGSTLSFCNIVTEMRSVGVVAEEDISVDIAPLEAGTGVAVVVQHDGVGQVIGAASFSV
jgi:hypothetical protein